MMPAWLRWLRAFLAAFSDPPNLDAMTEYYAWRDSRPDRLVDQAHREPFARARGDGLPVSRPEVVEDWSGGYSVRERASTLHYHHDDPSFACFERHVVDGRDASWLVAPPHWPRDTPDGSL